MLAVCYFTLVALFICRCGAVAVTHDKSSTHPENVTVVVTGSGPTGWPAQPFVDSHFNTALLEKDMPTEYLKMSYNLQLPTTHTLKGIIISLSIHGDSQGMITFVVGGGAKLNLLHSVMYVPMKSGEEDDTFQYSVGDMEDLWGGSMISSDHVEISVRVTAKNNTKPAKFILSQPTVTAFYDVTCHLADLIPGTSECNADGETFIKHKTSFTGDLLIDDSDTVFIGPLKSEMANNPQMVDVAGTLVIEEHATLVVSALLERFDYQFLLFVASEGINGTFGHLKMRKDHSLYDYLPCERFQPTVNQTGNKIYVDLHWISCVDYGKMHPALVAFLVLISLVIFAAFVFGCCVCLRSYRRYKKNSTSFVSLIDQERHTSQVNAVFDIE